MTKPPTTPTAETELKAELNGQTARIPWRELQRHYARGIVIVVDADLDLVDVAVKTVADDAAAIQDWRADNRVRNATDEDARAWLKRDAVLWAVVAAPWLLVQEQACKLSEAGSR